MIETLVFPIGIGTVVPGFGRISAVTFRAGDGERYYLLADERGTASLMPADVIERLVPQEGEDHA